MSLAHKTIRARNYGFTLAEALGAIAILAFIVSSTWVVIDRCVASTSNSIMKMQAFEVARENLEKILTMESVKEDADFGESERYPGIEWETIIETFYEPINSQMWLRAISTAYYYDTEGMKQSVELRHWLTGLNKNQLIQILMQQEGVIDELVTNFIKTIEDAADYAGVSPETIEEWLDKGMKTTDEDFFITTNLDLFAQNNGEPSKEDIKNLQVSSEYEFVSLKLQQNKETRLDEIDPTTGFTYGEMEQMDIKELWEILRTSREGGNYEN